MTRLTITVGLASLLTIARPLLAQDTLDHHDTTPHGIRFVTVQEDVKLEVLDWGGSGRPLILLHGGNSTAHEFDTFAPKNDRFLSRLRHYSTRVWRIQRCSTDRRELYCGPTRR